MWNGNIFLMETVEHMLNTITEYMYMWEREKTKGKRTL